jgi:spore coat polysaccharide biosynthesis protein SpsF (cytidylyltransferase family)/ubiquinone/menaquinone biosynthesis C-methylase UbiE
MNKPKVVAVVQCTYTDFLFTEEKFKNSSYGIPLFFKKDDLILNPNKYVISKLKSIKRIDSIVLAVPDIPENAIFEDISKHWNVMLCKGSEFNVTERILDAAKITNADIICRVLLHRSYLDVDLTEKIIDEIIKYNADYILLPCEFNLIFTGDVISAKCLKTVNEELQGNNYEIENWRFRPWSYVEFNPNKFNIIKFDDLPTYSHDKINKILGDGVNEEERSVWGDNFTASSYQKIKEFLSPSDVVLDIACGSGEGTAFLSKFCNQIIGIDIILNLSQSITSNLNRYPNMKFISADGQNFVYGNKIFDKIICLHTLEHLEDQQIFLQNLHTSLKNNGLLIIEVPLLSKKPLGVPLNPHHLREYDVKDFKNILETNGFKIMQIFGINRGLYTDVKYARESIQCHCVPKF